MPEPSGVLVSYDLIPVDRDARLAPFSAYLGLQDSSCGTVQRVAQISHLQIGLAARVGPCFDRSEGMACALTGSGRRG